MRLLFGSNGVDGGGDGASGDDDDDCLCLISDYTAAT